MSAREAKWRKLCAEEREVSIFIRILGEGSDEAAWLSHWIGRIALLQCWGPAWHAAMPLVKVELRSRRQDPNRISGRAWPASGRIVISCSASNAKNLAALVHEMAHIATPGARHKLPWKQMYAAALTELTGIEIPHARMLTMNTRLNEADLIEAFLARTAVAA